MDAPTAQDLPTVTMAVISYNQEKTIGYAVDSALAQDYEGPLTIVLSDDCSQDGTFRIMQEKAAAYKGPHKIILNRNDENLYVAGHLFKALSLAPSELQCKVDGDDYSAPDRVRRQVEAFCRYPSAVICLAWVKQVHVVSVDDVPDFSRVALEGDGAVSLCKPENDLTTLGCMTMWRPQLLQCAQEVLGAQARVFNEDAIMAHLAWLYGDVVMVEKELVYYVKHGGNLSCWSDARRFVSIRNYLQYEPERCKLVKELLHRVQQQERITRTWMDSHDDYDEARREKIEAYLAAKRMKMQEFQVGLEYGERSFPANVFHWLRYRDASVKCLIPLWLKGLVRCTQWKLRHRAGEG